MGSMVIAPYWDCKKVCAEVMLFFKLFSNDLPIAWNESGEQPYACEPTISWDVLKANKKEQHSWR